MNKMTFAAVAALSVLGSFAADATNAVQSAKVPKNGGMFRMERKNTKSVFFVNAQRRVAKGVIDAARLHFENKVSTPVKYAEGSFDFTAPKIEGELSLYIIDDEKMPMSLVAVEGRWAFVNVAPLAKGRGEKPAYFEARVRKECARVACMLFGGLGSSYKNNLLADVRSPDDLDNFDLDALPVDGVMRCAQTLHALGVKPYRVVPYAMACQEGWAPAPSNEVQQAIWKRVHELPAKPITIKYDPKKGK